MNVVGLIPARWQSSRFPGKPLTQILGKPMLWWVCHQCKKVSAIDEVIVATDDQRILEACESFGVSARITSRDHLTGTDRIAEVAASIDADLFINIQGDEPLVSPDSLTLLVDYCEEHPEVQAVNLVAPLFDAGQIVRKSVVKAVRSLSGDLLYLSRSPIPGGKGDLGESAIASSCFYRQLGIYAFRPATLAAFAEYGKREGKSPLEKFEDVEMLRLLEQGISVRALAVQENAPAVDYPSDVLMVEQLLKLQKETEQ